MEAQVLEQQRRRRAAARRRRAWPARRCSPRRTPPRCRPAPARAAAHSGASDIEGSRLPLGRPKWARTTTLAPLSSSSFTVGTERSIRVASVDLAVLHRHVQVEPDQDRAPGHLQILEGAQARHRPPRAQSVPRIAATSFMRLEKPHSLSYQEATRTSWPSSTLVARQIDRRAVAVVVEVDRDQRLAMVAEHALHRPVGRRDHRLVDLLGRGLRAWARR